LECQGFPEDERASLEALQYRQQAAPQLMLGCFVWRPPSKRRLVAFICATASAATSLTHESMSKHDAAGRSVNIHGVVVDASLRRQGVASALLKEYIQRLQTDGSYDRILLVNHEELTGLYEKAGFRLVGPSAVQHGSRPWLEMQYDLRPAAQSQQVEVRSPGQLLVSQSDLADASGLNKGKLYCPRRQCRCLLLRKGAARLVERSSEPVSPFI
jgi:GNAT superfamily N-acetyltransferase